MYKLEAWLVRKMGGQVKERFCSAINTGGYDHSGYSGWLRW
jgi:hypothetical protein